MGKNKVFLQRLISRHKIDLGVDNAISEKQENLYKQDASMEEKKKVAVAMDEKVKAVHAMEKKETVSNPCLDRVPT